VTPRTLAFGQNESEVVICKRRCRAIKFQRRITWNQAGKEKKEHLPPHQDNEEKQKSSGVSLYFPKRGGSQVVHRAPGTRRRRISMNDHASEEQLKATTLRFPVPSRSPRRKKRKNRTEGNGTTLVSRNRGKKPRREPLRH